MIDRCVNRQVQIDEKIDRCVDRQVQIDEKIDRYVDRRERQIDRLLDK